MTPIIPHPRDTFDYQGGEVAERSFVDALASGRLHHAWLLVGAEGIGKATFAYRAARTLLGASPDPALGILGARIDDPVCRQIAARAHPDLLVLQRDAEDGKTRKAIPVEEARGLSEFFAKTPASAPYRVAIIDTADDLNANAANAALKILEEPPQRGVLLLVSNAPGGLLATMRSRCRRLRFTSPDEAAASEWVAAKSGVDLADARRLVKMAKGAPGRAWRLASAGAIEADDAARALLRSLPRLDSSVMMGLADGFRGNGGPGRFEMMLERMADQVAAMASNQAVAGEGAMLDRWAETWETLVALPRDVESVNLDRVDAFYTALWRLRSIA